MSIGANIKKLREKTALTQADMAKKLNIDRRTYCTWENDEADVKDSFIPKIAEILGIEIADLFKNDLQSLVNIGYKQKNSFSVGLIIMTDGDQSEKLVDVLKGILEKKE